MQIAVLLKLVSQSTFMDSLAENVKDRLASGQLVINPADEYALELALRLRDRCNGSKVTVVTMSPACAEQVLYETLAMGADEAVHICDSAFAASDTLVTARILASALKKLPPQDMILCGQRSIDSETGHIGAQLAVYLEKPVITNTLSVWRDESDVLHHLSACCRSRDRYHRIADRRTLTISVDRDFRCRQREYLLHGVRRQKLPHLSLHDAACHDQQGYVHLFAGTGQGRSLHDYFDDP